MENGSKMMEYLDDSYKKAYVAKDKVVNLTDATYLDPRTIIHLTTGQAIGSRTSIHELRRRMEE